MIQAYTWGFVLGRTVGPVGVGVVCGTVALLLLSGGVLAGVRRG